MPVGGTVDGRDVGTSRTRIVLGLAFVGAGALHFVAPDAYEGIMPPYLPLQRELVLASGAAEILGGLGLLHERTRRPAGVWLVLLLLAVWPANLKMLLDARGASEPAWWVALLYARIPLQIPLMFLVWRASRAG